MSYEDFFGNLNYPKNKNILIPDNQDITDVIISKYNENVSYVKMFKNVYLYDKNPVNSENFYKFIKSDINYTHLKNVGRCDHTYLYHIINNYENLNTLNIFMSASVFLCENMSKLEIYNKHILISNNTKNSVFFRNSKPILEIFHDFKKTHHKTFTSENIIFDDCHILDQYNGNYKDWYIKNFGNISVNYGSFGSTLVLHKKHILQHSKKYYKNLIKYLDKHNAPETGHYFERAWGAVFYPIDKECIFNYSDVKNIQI